MANFVRKKKTCLKQEQIKWYAHTHTETTTSAYVERTNTTVALLSASYNYGGRQEEPFALLCMKQHCGWLKNKKPFTLFFLSLQLHSLSSVVQWYAILSGSAQSQTHALRTPHKHIQTLYIKKKRRKNHLDIIIILRKG